MLCVIFSISATKSTIITIFVKKHKHNSRLPLAISLKNEEDDDAAPHKFFGMSQQLSYSM